MAEVSKMTQEEYLAKMEEMQSSMRHESYITLVHKTELAKVDMQQDVSSTAINLAFKEAGRVHLDG
jgi:hypothetical protein